MEKFSVTPVASFETNESGTQIVVRPQYRQALQGIDGFSHLMVLWWFSECDDEGLRQLVEFEKPYSTGPAVMGTFATRGPVRPNPIAVTVVQVIRVDHENGVIHIPYTDANNGTPILDIKPYTPSNDRVENPGVPEWCSTWPRSLEASASFDWGSVFSF